MNKPDQSVVLLMTRIPFPPVGGDRVKSYHMVKLLHARFHLRIVIVSDEKASPEQIKFLEDHCETFKLFCFSPFRCRLNLVKVFWKRSMPLQVAYYQFGKVSRFLESFIHKDDIVISTLIRSAEYARSFPNHKVLDIVDSIYLNYKRSIDNVHSVFWKMVYRFELNRLERYERQCVKFFDCTTFVNYFESLEWSRFGKCIWIPNGVSQTLIQNHYPYRHHAQPSIAFFGKMDYQPNVDALKWFFGNVMDKLDPRIVVLVIGSNHSKLAQWFQSRTNRIQFTGYVDDPYAQLAQCECVIAPMQTGGGIQNKILESMAIGQIVITTSLAGSPIVGAVHGTHFFVEDYPQGMANRINEIVANRLPFEEVGRNAKSLIRSAYTWLNYEEKLLGCMFGVVGQVAKEESSANATTNQSVFPKP